MSDVTDLFPEGTFTEDPPDEAEEATEEVVDEPDDGGEDTEDSGDQEAPTEAPLIFGKYKTIEEAEKAHKGLEARFHADNQQPVEEEDEEAEEDDPYGLWGTALGNDEAQQLAQRMIERPQEAQSIFEYVQQNQAQFGPAGGEIAEQMFALWNAQNPYAAQSWIADQRMAAYQEQIQQQQAPLQSHYTQQMAGLAVHRASLGADALPRFAELKDQIMVEIQKPSMQAYFQNNPDYAKDPEKMYEVLVGAWTKVIADEYRSTAQHATTASGEPAPEIPAGKAKPRTQQRSTAAAPTPDGVDDLFPPNTFRQAG